MDVELSQDRVREASNVAAAHARAGRLGGLERVLPTAFLRLAGRLPQMPAAAPGKVGHLELRFERRGASTRLVHQYSTGPQRVGRVLYLDGALSDMAFVFIQSVGGGILQGDRLFVDIAVGPGARAHVTTQSAVKIYRAEADYAAQRVTASVESGGYLELMGDGLIPYRGSRFFNLTELTIADDATLVYGDSLAPGRVAFGESFEYQLLYSRTVARRSDGQLRAVDTTVLEPARHPPGLPGLLGGHTHLGSLLVLDDAVPGTNLASAMTGRLDKATGAFGAASALPRGGASVRVLADSAEAVQAAVHAAWDAARRQIVGAGVPAVQRYKYGFDDVEDVGGRGDELPK